VRYEIRSYAGTHQRPFRRSARAERPSSGTLLTWAHARIGLVRIKGNRKPSGQELEADTKTLPAVDYGDNLLTKPSALGAATLTRLARRSRSDLWIRDPHDLGNRPCSAAKGQSAHEIINRASHHLLGPAHKGKRPRRGVAD
jgi:hypothetical protein